MWILELPFIFLVTSEIIRAIEHLFAYGLGLEWPFHRVVAVRGITHVLFTLGHFDFMYLYMDTSNFPFFKTG